MNIPIQIRRNIGMSVTLKISEYNKKEDAVGWLQIRPIMVAEANRISGVEMFWPEDRETKSGSFIIFAKIMEAKNPTLDIRKACRIWNPRGGEKYYRRVMDAFNGKAI